MSDRVLQMLGRFPAHLEATRPGKQIGVVTEALAQDLDPLSSDLAAVRRSHRLAHADTLRDILLLGGLHGLASADLDVLSTRFLHARSLLAKLDQAVQAKVAADRDTWAEALFDLWGIAAAPPRLPLYAPLPQGAAVDLDEAAKRLGRTLRPLTGYRALVDAARERVGQICQLHAAGNGTVRALLMGAASALGLEMDLDKNQRLKDEWQQRSRPTVTITQLGEAQSTPYTYVVVARSRTKSIAWQSAPVTISTGSAALTDANCNVISWNLVPDALDYLVFRTASGGTPSQTGLLTPDPLSDLTTSFKDTGQPADGALAPEIDEDLFHSRDRFWHSTFVRDRVQIERRVEPKPPPKAITLDGTIAVSDLATQLGVQVADVLKKMIDLTPTPPAATKGSGIDCLFQPDAASAVAQGFGAVIPVRATITASQLAAQLGIAPAALFAKLLALQTAGTAVVFSFNRGQLDPLAAEFGFAVVEPRRIPIGASVVVDDLARLMAATPEDVLKNIAALDFGPATLETTLSFDQARQLAEHMGFEAVTERVVEMEQTITVADLAVRIGQRGQSVLKDLEVLGVAAVDASSLVDPDAAAQVARKYFYGVQQTLAVKDELLGLEENPVREYPPPDQEAELMGSRGRKHAQLFHVLRRGFGHTRLRIHVGGRDNLTVGPMVVNRDEGHGVGFAGSVPAGKTLVVNEDGHALLDGTDATGFAYAWKGACFADADDHPLHPHDSVFDGAGVDPSRRAVFAVATPDGALDPGFSFPHTAPSIPVPGIGVGVTRFGFFVQEAHFSFRDDTTDPPAISAISPRPKTGFADASVFADTSVSVGPGGEIAADGEGPERADVWLSWLDHEAYAVRVLLPSRFALLDGPGPTTAERVKGALDRFRPVGVQLYVEYLDDRWILGQSAVSEADAADPILALQGGTVLWSPPA